jgi:hypothetical protein
MKQVRFLIAALLVVLAAPLVPAQNRFEGSWTAVLAVGGQRCTVNLIMGPGQRYSEIVRCGTLITRQAGTYVLGQNGLLVRNVMDWDPKRRWVQDTGYRGHWEINAKPPGGSYQVTFASPNTMVWKDVNFGGVVTFRRAG